MRVRIRLLAFVVVSAPLPAFAASTVTFPVVGLDRTVQGDAAQTLRLRVCNTGGTAIDRVRLLFNAGNGNDQYDFSENQVNVVPTGWGATRNGPDDIRFDAAGAADRIAVGACRDFDILLEGNGGAVFQSGVQDQVDRFDRVDIRHQGSGTDPNPAATLTWTRHGLALTLAASPASVAPNGAVRLEYLVENRTTATQNLVSSLPLAPTTVPPGFVTGPAGTTPATLSLAPGVGGSLVYDATAGATAGYFRFSASVQQSGGATTSPPASSGEVAVGAFTAQLAVEPTSAISTQSFDVVMTVKNNGFAGPSALGNVVPSRDPLTRDPILDPDSIGTAVPGVTKVSGPFPASVPSLSVGASAQFRWTYTVTGALDQTYQFRGGAIANGTESGLATSNAGMVAPFSIRVVPPVIARGETGPVTFHLSNGTTSSSNRHIRFTFEPGFILDTTTPVVPPAGYSCTRDSDVRVTCNVTAGAWDPGETLPFQLFFDPLGVPIPPGTADAPYPVEVHFHLPSGANSQKPEVTLLVAAYRLSLAASPSTPQPADGNTPVTLTATLTRVSTGLPVSGATVTFTSTIGSLSAGSATTNAAGQATVVLTAPSSSTAVSGTATASALSRSDQVALSFTGFAGGNLLYVGGTLFPRQVSPGSSVAFSIYVTNVGTADVTVPTAVGDTVFDMQDGVPANAYQSVLSGSQTIAPGATVMLSFGAVTVNPAFSLGVFFPTFSYNPTRTIGDPVTVTSAAPTFASVVALDAEPWEGGARISWSTDLEFANTGFRVLRSENAGEPEVVGWVPASGASFSSYEFVDPELADGAYAYWVEDVADGGEATRHGPVALFLGIAPGSSDSAETPVVAARFPDAADDARWVDPASLGDVRVLEQDETGITFEIVPPPYEIKQVAWPVLLRDRIRIPGWGHTEDEGLPDLPARSLNVPIPVNASGRLTIRSIDEIAVEGVSPTWYLETGVGEGFSLSGGATVSTTVTRPTRLSSPLGAEGAEELYPPSIVSYVERGRMGDRTIASLVVTPIRFDAAEGRLHSASRIVAHVDFVPAAPSPTPGLSDAERVQDRILGGASLEVTTGIAGGLVRVPLPELVSAGVDPQLAQVYRRGVSVPSRIVGSELVFLAPPGESPWSASQTYWLAARGMQESANTIPLAPGGAPTPSSTADIAVRTRHVEEEVVYGFLANQGLGDDRWYWAEVMTSGPLSRTVTFDVPGAAPVGGASLTATLQGMYDDPDVTNSHVVRLVLNGSDLGTATIPDNERRSFALTVPAGVLVAGSNVLEIVCESTTASRVALDAVDVAWSTTADATGAGTLSVTAAASGVLTAGGFTEPPIFALDETDPFLPVLLPLATATDGLDWRAAVVASEGRRVRFATSLDGGFALTPRPAHSGLLHGDGADYLVIAASDLLAPAAEWAAWRSTSVGGGFRTALVDIADVYDTVSYGDPDPSAVERFLERVHAEWPLPAPRYVLLVGDSTFDPLDHTGAGAPSGLLLAPHVDTALLTAASDVRSAALGTADFLPDVSMGRIPARTPEEVWSALAKTEAYELAPRDGWHQRETLLADDDMEEFDSASEEAAGYLPVGMEADVVSAAVLGDAAAEAQLLESLSTGQALVTYLGHGGIQTWGGEGYLDVANVPALPESRTPVVLAVDCLNAYFDFPQMEGLGEELLRADNAGAAAVWASTAITRNGGHRDLAIAFHHAFWRKPLLRLGEVTREAASEVAWRADAEELIQSFVLLGDPALRLNVNRAPIAVATLESVDELTARVSAKGSFDADGDPLAFRWEVLSAPVGAVATIKSDPAPGEGAMLTATAPGRYRLRLLAADSHLAGPPDELAVELRADGDGGGAPGSCSVAPGAPTFPLLALIALALAMIRRR